MQPVSHSYKQRRTLSLKAKLAGAILITVSATAAIVHFPWLWASSRNINSIVDQLNEAITRQTSREVGNIFSNVKSAQVLIQSTFLSGMVDLNNKQAREEFYLNVLEANPNLTWVQFGYPNGNYLGLQRGENGRINIINRVYNPQTEQATKTVESYQRIGRNLQLIGTETKPETYYAPQRPWYQAAMANRGEQAWTNVYVFATGKVPGIDSAITLEDQGRLLGVISIAFDLKQIAAFLKHLQGDRDGAIFIVNSRGELIAFNDPQAMEYTLTGQDTAKLITIAGSKNNYLSFAYQTFQANNVSLTQLHSRFSDIFRDPETGERYYISIAPLNHLDWSVGTVIPESNYLGEINRNKTTLFFIVSGFIVVAAGTAMFLTDRFIARPVMNIAKAAADIEAEKFEINCLNQVAKQDDELGQLARVFQNMAREVYAREQRLKQTVQELRIEIDETKRKKQVNEIVESDFFQDLQAKARVARNRLGSAARREMEEEIKPDAPKASIDSENL
ncbi:MAG: cache domain-containing protein [Oculatellaceae cyanobacterium bins.114]|nr:cache domain-containing protein [Oculatellaceae cyanobacterium bins.114]